MVHVVLEQCSLETVKTKKGFELLNCDDHIGVCKRNGRDPSEYRPDIVHQVLLALMDSPLNKAGHLHVLMLTKKNVLIEISAHTRIPRTFKRFCGLMGASRPGCCCLPISSYLTPLTPLAYTTAFWLQCNCCTTCACALPTAMTRLCACSRATCRSTSRWAAT